MNGKSTRPPITGEHEGKGVVDPHNLTLDCWIGLMEDENATEKYIFDDFRFPSDKIHDEYLSIASRRTDIETKKIIRRFLIP
ncbi:MAG: hypothetical protein ACR2PS_12565, partial [Pseudomonadales bacterium]